MIRRLLSILMLAAVACTAAAQSSGTWNVLPVYSGQAQSLVDTPDRVYYLTHGHLFSYNKDTDETQHYSTVNKLNDIDIQYIAYNPYKRYLAVVYATSNIDLLYDNGKVVNLPDIDLADITAEKSINNVTFSKSGRMYVATAFGYVAFDDAKHRVADSGIFNRSVSYAGEVDGNVVLSVDGDIMVSPAGERHNTLDKFSKIGTIAGTQQYMMPLGDKQMVVRAGEEGLQSYYIVKPDFAAGTADIMKIDQGRPHMELTQAPDGRVRFAQGTVAYLVDIDGSKKVEYILPSEIGSKLLATYSGGGDVWTSDTDGIAHYKVDTQNGALTQLMQPMRPESLTCYWPAIMRLSADGSRIYISNMGYSAFRQENVSVWDQIQQTTNVIEDGHITDVSCVDDNGNLIIKGSTQDIVVDPTDPTTYFVANDVKGIYIVKDNKLVGMYDASNAPFYANSNRSWLFNVNFDRFGNLWIGLWKANNRNAIYILPAEKVRHPESTTRADWLAPDVQPYTQASGSFSLLHSKSNYAIYGSDHGYYGLLFYDHNGTPTDLSDDTTYAFTHCVDQDGNEIKINRVFSIFEDSKGRIWIGMQAGVAMIPDVSTAIQGNTLHVRRPKVARNDGTNYADYLLKDDYAFDICEDPSGRKWFATQRSGVYLVSDDGTEIVEHFTADDSPLPSNKVFSIKADPNGNMVYMGTEKGVVSYTGNASPGAEDYSDVYAYPNPVRPEYTGWITITGLMDNSLVKITDAAGNLVAQGTSEGGLYLWDGCNSANQRVRSGVYFVFASQNAEGTSASGKAATKILVIN